MKHEATLHFSFSDASASAIHGALAPETAADVPKTSSEVERDGADVRVHIAAEDLSSLRAALNSWLRWIDAAERAARVAR